MQLAVWTYEGPPHVGAMRVATAMRDVHLVLHAPQGDTYADLLFTMIERRGERPPVSYTTFQARDLGRDTAEIFQTALRDAYERFRPAAMLVAASCTAELIQDDPAGLAKAAGLPVPVIPVELHSYQRKENWGAAETFYALVRALAPPVDADRRRSSPLPRGEGSGVRIAPTPPESYSDQREGISTLTPCPSPQGRGRIEPSTRRPRCNILGPTALGFRHRDDVAEITHLLATLGIEVKVTAPLGAGPDDLARLPEADFNVVLYPEVADTAARWLQRTYAQPFTTAIPIGVAGTRRFIEEVARLAGVDPTPALAGTPSNLPWFSRSVDSTYLTGKRVFVFGDATHAVAAARVARDEFGFAVVGLGTYAREFARDLRAAAAEFGVEPLVTDDYLAVEAAIAALRPELVLGTQMERHIAKRLGIACAVISAPVHVQDFPARYSPQMGFEGANVLWDSWVHPLMMGLEEHLLGMFRDDPEFHDGAAASHLHPTEAARDIPVAATAAVWSREAERELGKIPFFVRGKARRNTEAFAAERHMGEITLETLYDAKAHFGGR